MNKEAIAIELTKIYFTKSEKATKEEVKNIYDFFIESLYEKLKVTPILTGGSTITDLSKIKPVK